MTIKLVQTCGACPEQYDAYDGERLVGYLRLRHGYFSVNCPHPGGVEVYATNEVEGDGAFEPHERDYYLRFAVDAIQKWIVSDIAPLRERPPAPDVEYSIE